jgi:hypothetical protein
MPPRSLVRSFLLLYFVTGLVVLLLGVLTAWQALQGHGHPQDRIHAVVLGSVEAVAAILFLVPRAVRWGAAGLLGVFAIALAIHALQGSVRWDLLVYAVVVYFVREHGVTTRYFQVARGCSG